MRLTLLPILLFSLGLSACSGEGRQDLVDTGTTADATGDVGETDLLPGDFGAADEACVPACAGKECGDDGCGGTCGTCPAAAPICNESGKCEIECIPDCEDKECGDDGCGGDCGTCPAVAPYCVDNKCAVDCEPACDGLECGDDGCGGSCGDCAKSEACVDGLCECVPDCQDKECGDDGCGGNCGECPEETPFCLQGTCTEECTPDCEGKECGDDGCGGDCGECDEGDSCVDGQCECQTECPAGYCGPDGCGSNCGGCECGEECVDDWCVYVGCGEQQCGDDGCGNDCGSCPEGASCQDGLCIDSCLAACLDKECGSDGCGGFCGTCAEGLLCSAAGECVAECTPDCTGKECGSDGCGGDCGNCWALAGEFCVDGTCVTECPTDCQGKVCGDDGCGGSCGSCDDDLLCTLAGTCGNYCSQCTYHPDCYDITFAGGSISSWAGEAVLLLTEFGQTTPPTGGYMLKLTTGEGLTEEGSFASFQNCLPAGKYMVLVKWRLYSEEFKEWCGSQYQDSMQISVTTDTASEVLAEYVIDDLCPPAECQGCGGAYEGLIQSTDIMLDQGDAWNTYWREEWVPMNLSSNANQFTLTVSLADAGDGVYDTVLLVDRVRFVPCAQACDYIECGLNPCGDECGSCGEDGLCQDGTCCYPSCAGKECGDDGCGGTCGQCGVLSACHEGTCECLYEQCDDGCCAAGEVCAAVSGKCCAPLCLGNPCGDDGCGGTCPGTGGIVCCVADADCDDNDDCTVETCQNGQCQYTNIGGPGCCEPFSWGVDFDSGTNEGFTIANDGGSPLPGFEAGWSVTELCGAHSSPYALYFGFSTGMLGNCVYDIGFPMPIPLGGTATSPQLNLEAGTVYQLDFWTVLDIQAGGTDLFKVEAVKNNMVVSTLYSKADHPYPFDGTWRHVTVDVTELAGQGPFAIRFHFTSAGGQGTNKKGILLDDIAVTRICGP